MEDDGEVPLKRSRVPKVQWEQTWEVKRPPVVRTPKIPPIQEIQHVDDLDFPPIVYRVADWCMPNGFTSKMKPVREMFETYIDPNWVTVDPFAADCHFGTITNDLNPHTEASSHMDARAFIKDLIEQGIEADCVILDPPFSPRQIKECFESIGLKASQNDTQHAALVSECKKGLSKLLKTGGLAISIARNITGFGKGLGFRKIDGLILDHGSSHDSTIITVERKL